MDNIYYFKLVNGQEFIANVLFEDQIIVEVENPLCIEEVPNEDGKSTVLLTPYTPFSKKSTFEFNKNHILVKYPINEIIENYYKLSKQFTAKHEQYLLNEIIQVNKKMVELLLDSLDEEEFNQTIFKVESKLIH